MALRYSDVIAGKLTSPKFMLSRKCKINRRRFSGRSQRITHRTSEAGAFRTPTYDARRWRLDITTKL